MGRQKSSRRDVRREGKKNKKESEDVKYFKISVMYLPRTMLNY